jgi:hypothetical protein
MNCWHQPDFPICQEIPGVWVSRLHNPVCGQNVSVGTCCQLCPLIWSGFTLSPCHGFYLYAKWKLPEAPLACCVQALSSVSNAHGCVHTVRSGKQSWNQAGPMCSGAGCAPPGMAPVRASCFTAPRAQRQKRAQGEGHSLLSPPKLATSQGREDSSTWSTWWKLSEIERVEINNVKSQI